MLAGPLWFISVSPENALHLIDPSGLFYWLPTREVEDIFLSFPKPQHIHTHFPSTILQKWIYHYIDEVSIEWLMNGIHKWAASYTCFFAVFLLLAKSSCLVCIYFNLLITLFLNKIFIVFWSAWACIAFPLYLVSMCISRCHIFSS